MTLEDRKLSQPEPWDERGSPIAWRKNNMLLTPKILIQIAKEGTADIEGTKLGFAWGKGQVLFWSANTSIPCPKCERQCKECLVMKTDTGDVYVCSHCQEFVLWNGGENDDVQMQEG